MTATPDDHGVGTTPGSRRVQAKEFLEFLGLCGIAVAEPVLTAFRGGADVFVLRDADAMDIVVFTAIIVLGPPLALWSILQVAGAVLPSRREMVRNSLLGLVATVITIRALSSVDDLPRAIVLLGAFAVGFGLALALRRWRPLTTWLRILAVFPVLLGFSFVLTDPIARLVLDDDGAGVGSAPVGQPDPVVVLVLDELPTASLLDDDDAISATQFPNLAAFAQDATWYRNHTSVAPSTPQAVPAILTGLMPTSLDTLPVAAEHPDNLFTALAGAYQLHVQEGATQLCPERLCRRVPTTNGAVGALLDDALALWSDQLSSDREARQGDFTIRQSDPNAPVTFNTFLAGIGDTDRATLEFHHTLYPHQPWFHLPSGLTYEAPFVAEGLAPPNYAWVNEEAADSGRQRHLLQARHADALVGQLMSRLQEFDRYDESLIVVTADHGVAFDRDDPVRGLAGGNTEQVMWTPLLVKAPDQTEGRLDEQPVQAVDVLPTIADHLDLELPFPTDGHSVRRPLTDDVASDERLFFDWSLNTLPADEQGLVRIDGEAGYRELLALPAPGLGDDPELRFYRFGRHGDLVGRAVADETVTASVDGDAELEQQGELTVVDLEGPTLPAYLSGSIPGEDQVDVAVAVNGTIGGWGHSEPDEADSDRQHFWAMVPPALLVGGTNDVEVFVIDDLAGRRVLRPVPLPILD